MSRSKFPKCPGGRGCYVCGDRGEIRRRREQERGAADLGDGLEAYLSSPARLDHPWKYEACLDWRAPNDDPYEALDLDGFDEHPDCDYCGALVPEFDVPGVTLQRSTEAKLCVDVLPRGVVSVSG